MPPEQVSSRTELEELTERVEGLERRVAALEQSPHTPAPGLAARTLPASGHFASVEAAEVLPEKPHLGVLSIIGKAVVGIAGAYALRAIAESAILPAWIVLVAALLYAAAWLVRGAWPRTQPRLTRRFYAVTSALILSPLLWEATVRFQMLAPRVSAALLVAFALLGIVLAQRTSSHFTAWIAVLTAVVTAFVLMVATRALLPFTISLLAIALLTEFATARERWPGLRPIVSAGADFSVLIIVLILGSPARTPAGYQPVNGALIVSLAAALLSTYAVSIAIRSLAFRLKVSVVEGAQLVIAVLLMSWAALRVTNGEARIPLGVFFFAAGAGCYFAAFGVLARHRERPNFYFYGLCGLIFVAGGSFLTLTSLPLVAWLSFAALTATVFGVRLSCPALDVHGVAYLAAAAIASGLLNYANRALTGTYPGLPGALPLLTIVTALVCTVLIARYPGERSGERVLRLLPAVLTVYAVAALAVVALVRVFAATAPTRPELAVIRTVVTCVTVLLLAWIGARWTRRELVWIAYAAAILGSLKLLFEDLRFGTAQSLAASLLIYGAVLILIPRLVRAGKRLA